MDRRAVGKRFECAFAHLGLASPETWGTVRGGETGDAQTVVSVVEREDVRRAYRRLLLRAHPDRNGGRSEAYETLIEARDAAYAVIDERDLLACASRYDWRASRRKSKPREGRGEDLGARPRRVGDDSAGDETEETTTTRTTTTTMENLDDVRAYVHGKDKALARVETRFVHESKVTALTSRLGFVATGEINGRVQLWREDGSLVARFDSPLRDDVKTNDAVSILRFGASGRLGITYVTTKPRVCRVDFDECSVSSPTQTSDGHVGRITAGKWFEHDEDAGQGICDVFATGSIDGGVFLRSFSLPLLAVEASSSKEFRACVALDVLATSANGGVLVVADTAGKFRLWNVSNDLSGIEVSPLTNVVAWSGFGGVSSCTLALAPNDEMLRLLTSFNNPATKQSRVLEWKIPRRGLNNTVHGFSAAFPGENETFTGSIAHCVTAPPMDDEDEETHLVVVDDSVIAVGANSRTVLYVVDAPNCRRCVLSSSQNLSDSDAFLSVAASTPANRAKAALILLRLHSLDDGSSLGESRLSPSDVFGDESSYSSSSSSAFVFEDSQDGPRAAAAAAAAHHRRGWSSTSFDRDDDDDIANEQDRGGTWRVRVGCGCVVASILIQRVK